MKRSKKDIESEIRQNLCEAYSLFKEYMTCSDKNSQWAKSSLDFSIDGLEALNAFLKKQRSKFDSEEEIHQARKNNNENITITEDEE